ncbi:hypothetical protein MtrunA17_Chr7g0254151 [Medicago truncatula]|uniref:Transmembrane protein, putative n=1 Tax=Medicago truncatula TaxID=3880 RepID=A2Q4B1_MEDTR|nr:uncharacterized protein LOC11432647 [Medicago truncatula]ABN08461.1 hypothetical protein MtrDRAFT_AC157472g30v2 [Medicago truncatula]AES80942.1 transmembrane protein, putative [Medicago truncatula]AFK36202.1 unknown [Medicago truncatula]RHN47546.1 hypothetical protein MtrunA17_Chr7g0254151 [Medicago truncatula]
MQRNFLSLLVLLLFFLSFSYVLSSSASLATRTKNLKGEDTSSQPSLAMVDGNYGEKVMVVDKEEALVERRMDLETQDYGGTGANTDHEPKPPRRI